MYVYIYDTGATRAQRRAERSSRVLHTSAASRAKRKNTRARARRDFVEFCVWSAVAAAAAAVMRLCTLFIISEAPLTLMAASRISVHARAHALHNDGGG